MEHLMCLHQRPVDKDKAPELRNRCPEELARRVAAEQRLSRLLNRCGSVLGRGQRCADDAPVVSSNAQLRLHEGVGDEA